MTSARRLHLLLGVFFAPTIVYFAMTGVLMTLGFASRAEGRKPPQWVLHLVEVHKHQKWDVRARPPQPSAPSQKPAQPAPPPEEKSLARAVLQGFVAVMGAGLAATTVLGIVICWRVPRDRKLVVGLVALGSIVPILLLAI